jgi:hypothetical protein
MVGNFSCIHHVNYALVKSFYAGIFISLISQARDGVCRWEYPYCIPTFRSSSIFHENYELVEILSIDGFISFFIMESHGGAWKQEYLYHVATVHFHEKYVSQYFIKQHCHLMHGGVHGCKYLCCVATSCSTVQHGKLSTFTAGRLIFSCTVLTACKWFI